MNKKIKKILIKKNKSKIVCLTAYSKNIAEILDQHCDLILVGDSLANVLYGMKNTHNLKSLFICIQKKNNQNDIIEARLFEKTLSGRWFQIYGKI